MPTYNIMSLLHRLNTAPPDAAFDALEDGALDNIEELTNVLLYHVVAANAQSSSLSTGYVETLNGQSVMLTVTDSGVMVDDANVLVPDVIASNGNI